MALFYVFQGLSYKEEFNGNFVWAPQRDKAGIKIAVLVK